MDWGRAGPIYFVEWCLQFGCLSMDFRFSSTILLSLIFVIGRRINTDKRFKCELEAERSKKADICMELTIEQDKDTIYNSITYKPTSFFQVTFLKEDMTFESKSESQIYYPSVKKHMDLICTLELVLPFFYQAGKSEVQCQYCYSLRCSVWWEELYYHTLYTINIQSIIDVFWRVPVKTSLDA